MEDISILETIMWERIQTVLLKPSQAEKEIIEKITEKKNEENLRMLVKKIGNLELEKQINDFIDRTLEDLANRDAVTMEKYYRQRF